jgi:hypothetical protein
VCAAAPPPTPAVIDDLLKERAEKGGSWGGPRPGGFGDRPGGPGGGGAYGSNFGDGPRPTYGSAGAGALNNALLEGLPDSVKALWGDVGADDGYRIERFLQRQAAPLRNVWERSPTPPKVRVGVRGLGAWGRVWDTQPPNFPLPLPPSPKVP